MKTVALDIETTGFDPHNDALIEIAIITFDETGITDRWSTLLNPGHAIPQIVTTLTGITDADLKNAPLFADVQKIIEEKIADAAIVGHFISFDTGFLKAKGINVPNVLLDTYDLARVLLPCEKSYSLEILTEKWHITQTQKHRALSDTEATIELLDLLKEKIQKIPQEKENALRVLLTKSTWPWKEIFLKNLTKNNEKNAPKKEEKPKKQSENGTVNAYSSLEPNAQNVLHEPHDYLCFNKYQAYYKKETLSQEETTLALKIILSEKRDDEATQHAFLPAKEEKEVWYAIASDPVSCSVNCTTEKCAWISARKKLKNEKQITCTHTTLLRELTRDASPLFTENRAITIHAVENLAQILHFVWTETLSPERLHRFIKLIDDAAIKDCGIKIDLFFGLLSVLIEKEGNHDGWTKKLLFTEAIKGTKNWNEAEKILQQCLIIFHDFFKKQKNPVSGVVIALGSMLRQLEHAMRLDEKLKICAELNEREGVKIHITASKTEEILEKLWTQKNIRVSSEILTPEGIDTKFIKKVCRIPETIQIAKNGIMQRALWMIPEKKIETIAAEHDTTIILTSAKAHQEKFYYEIASSGNTELQVLSPHLTGGKGKVIHQWNMKNGKKKVLCATFHWFLNQIHEITLTKGKNALIIGTIPFPPPQDGKQTSFMEETIPRTLLTLKAALHSYIQKNQDETMLFFLDQRIKNYNGVLLDNLDPLIKF